MLIQCVGELLGSDLIDAAIVGAESGKAFLS
jgi:hypothetical protein